MVLLPLLYLSIHMCLFHILLLLHSNHLSLYLNRHWLLTRFYLEPLGMDLSLCLSEYIKSKWARICLITALLGEVMDYCLDLDIYVLSYLCSLHWNLYYLWLMDLSYWTLSYYLLPHPLIQLHLLRYEVLLLLMSLPVLLLLCLYV